MGLMEEERRLRERVAGHPALVDDQLVTMDLAGPVARLVLRGDIDLTLAPRIIDALASASCQGEVEVDLTEATFIDSSGIGVLVTVVRDGMYLAIVGANDGVRRAFDVAGVGHLMNLD
jgi:anti-anti-sigma factor